MKQRHILPNSTAIEDLNSEAVVFIRNTQGGQPQAYGFKSAKTIKPDFNYRFRSEPQRAAYIADFFVRCAAREKNKQARHDAQKAKKAAFENPLAIGDILYASWGYDQTNIDYYQVVRMTAKTVTFRELRATQTTTGFMCGDIVPNIGDFASAKEWTRPVKPSYDGSPCVPFAEYPGGYQKNLHRWDGRPMHNSWYA